MMTADQILAAHARMPARKFNDAPEPKPQDPWWKATSGIGGDLRAFKLNERDSQHAENS